MTAIFPQFSAVFHDWIWHSPTATPPPPTALASSKAPDNASGRCADEFKTSSKRVISTKGKSLQSVIPEHFAYFHVECGLDGGYLHLIGMPGGCERGCVPWPTDGDNDERLSGAARAVFFFLWHSGHHISDQWSRFCAVFELRTKSTHQGWM